MHSTDTHPLLSEELLRIKAPIQREGLAAIANGSSDEQGGDVVDTFGSLAISDTGRTNYFGQATSSFVRFASSRPAYNLMLTMSYYPVLPSGLRPSRSILFVTTTDIEVIRRMKGSKNKTEKIV